MPAFISFIEGNERTEEQQEKSRVVLSMEAKEKEDQKRRIAPLNKWHVTFKPGHEWISTVKWALKYFNLFISMVNLSDKIALFYIYLPYITTCWNYI